MENDFDELFASDCELENEDSLHLHIAMGFEEANRIIEVYNYEVDGGC